jgi:hypothetical protein
LLLKNTTGLKLILSVALFLNFGLFVNAALVASITLASFPFPISSHESTFVLSDATPVPFTLSALSQVSRLAVIPPGPLVMVLYVVPIIET